MALPVPRAVRVALGLARLCALVVCAMGGLVLASWYFDLSAFDPLFPDLHSMAPNAGAGVFAAGLGLLCLTYRSLRPIAWLIGFALVLFGTATVAQDLFRFDLGIDRVLLGTATAAAEASTRMAPGIAGSLIMFGLALLCAKGNRLGSAISQILAIAMLAQVLIVLTGNAYGVSTADFPFPFTSMSAYGLLSVLLLAIGLLAASPEEGVAAAVIEKSPAGEMLRRLLPGILVLPLVIGWFARQAETASYYDSAATLAIFAVSSIIVLAAFTWTTIDAVRRSDRARNEALIELRGQREWLSTTVGSISEGVIATDPSGSVLLLNKVAEQLTGWPLSDARGRPIWEVFRVIDEKSRKPLDDPALRALRERATTRLESGALLLTRDDKELPIEDSGAPILGFDGSLAGAVLIFRDVTERRRAAQRQTMLVGELNHRVKNVLAIVQSLVQASLRQATNRPAQAMAQTLSERLRALHRAHDLLLEAQWSGASLKAMVERELEPYQREGGPTDPDQGTGCAASPAMHLDPRHDPARARHQRGEIRRAVCPRRSAQCLLEDGARKPAAADLGGAWRRRGLEAQQRLRHAAHRQGRPPQSRRRHQGRFQGDGPLCRAERAARAGERPEIAAGARRIRLITT